MVRARKLLAQITNDVIAGNKKKFIRTTLYNGNKKESYANHTKG